MTSRRGNTSSAPGGGPARAPAEGGEATATLQFKRPKLPWRRLLLGSSGAGAVAGAVWLGRAAVVPEAGAAPAPPAPATEAPAPPPSAPAEPSDYTQRVVAFV